MTGSIFLFLSFSPLSTQVFIKNDIYIEKKSKRGKEEKREREVYKVNRTDLMVANVPTVSYFIPSHLEGIFFDCDVSPALKIEKFLLPKLSHLNQ